MENLINGLSGQGYRVGAVKSNCHRFELDIQGKDSWKFTQAGALATAIIGQEQYAVIQKTTQAKELDDVLKLIADVDIILVEGFKAAGKPKIEVVRQAVGSNRISAALNEIIAVVTDVKEIAVDVPVFGLDAYPEIIKFIVNAYLEPQC